MDAHLYQIVKNDWGERYNYTKSLAYERDEIFRLAVIYHVLLEDLDFCQPLLRIFNFRVQAIEAIRSLPGGTGKC